LWLSGASNTMSITDGSRIPDDIGPTVHHDVV
jgi:hypothetical protein